MNYFLVSSQVFCLVFLWLFSPIHTCLGQTVCPGDYGGHLQGVTTDQAKNIFWSFTTDLIKTDANGKILAKSKVPNHHGDLTFHDEKIFVAVNLGQFNKEKGQADSWVYVYGAKKLELLSKHRVPEVVHGAGGIGRHKEHFFVVGGLPKKHKHNYVYQYDATFKYIKKHTIKSGYTRMGIQTACYAQGFWWFGCYGNTLLKTDAAFQLLAKYKFDGALGISNYSGKTLLIGRKVKGKQNRGLLLFAETDKKKGIVVVKKNKK